MLKAAPITEAQFRLKYPDARYVMVYAMNKGQWLAVLFLASSGDHSGPRLVLTLETFNGDIPDSEIRPTGRSTGPSPSSH